jgi:hypothetical protein
MIVFDVNVVHATGKLVHAVRQAPDLKALYEILREDAKKEGTEFQRIFNFIDIRLASTKDDQ